MTSILQSPEWKLIANRFPLVEKELGRLSTAIKALEEPGTNTTAFDASVVCSPEEATARTKQARILLAEMVRPKATGRVEILLRRKTDDEVPRRAFYIASIEQAIEDKRYEILVHERSVPPFAKADDKIIHCSIYLNCQDHAYHYKDENNQLVAIRFARTGVVCNLVEPKHKRRTWLINPCPICGTKTAEVCPHPEEPEYGFIGHRRNNQLGLGD